MTNPTSIQAFLEGINLPQYTELFLAQAITVQLLPSLTAEDLDRMGVTLVGHQRAILTAAAGLEAPTPPQALTVQSGSEFFRALRHYQRTHADNTEIFFLPSAPLEIKTRVATRFPLLLGEEPLVLLNNAVFKKGRSGVVLSADAMVTPGERIARNDVNLVSAKPVLLGVEIWANQRKVFDLTQVAKKDTPLIDLILKSWKAGELAHECLVVWPAAVKTEPVAAVQVKDGDSIGFGFCPSCGPVGVRTSGAGYHPGCLSITIHLLLCLITVGGWFSIWIGWALYHLIFNKGTQSCMKCGQLLAK